VSARNPQLGPDGELRHLLSIEGLPRDILVRILDTAPVESHTPVRYGVAAAWTSKHISAAGDFIEFLLSPQIQTLLQEFGFDRVPSDAGFKERREVKP